MSNAYQELKGWLRTCGNEPSEHQVSLQSIVNMDAVDTDMFNLEYASLAERNFEKSFFAGADFPYTIKYTPTHRTIPRDANAMIGE